MLIHHLICITNLAIKPLDTISKPLPKETEDLILDDSTHAQILNNLDFNNMLDNMLDVDENLMNMDDVQSSFSMGLCNKNINKLLYIIKIILCT